MRGNRRRVIREMAFQPTTIDKTSVDPAGLAAALDLRNALNRLSPDDRALLALRYVAGLDATQLSRAMACRHRARVPGWAGCFPLCARTLTMSEQDFEQRFQRLLRDDAEQGVRPVDAGAVARAATDKGARRGERGWWTRGARYLLAAALIVVGVAAAFGLGSRLLVVPTSTATPGPTATAVAQSPAPTATQAPTNGPSPTPTPSPTTTPTLDLTPSPTLGPSASPSPTPTLTPPPSPTPFGWVALTSFPSYGADTNVTGIAHGGDRFVAVGWSSRNGSTRGRVWTSLDGQAWKAQPDSSFAGLSLQAVTYNGSEFYAFASAPTTVWHSADGSAWQKVLLPTAGGELGTFDAFTGGSVGRRNVSRHDHVRGRRRHDHRRRHRV